MRKQAGFGIMEALVFSGLASVLVLGTTAMLSRNSWQIKLMNVQSARNSLATVMRSQMADPALCTAGLGNRTNAAIAGVSSAEVAFTLLGGSTTIQRGSIVGDNQLSVASFRIEGIKDSGLVGASGFPIQTGEMLLDVQSPEVGAGTIALKPISLGHIYVETSGATFVSCFNNDGPYGAAAMACIQFGGVNTTSGGGLISACDSTGFQNAINQKIHEQVDAELAGPYWQYVMGQADGQIAIRSKETYDLVTSKAGAYRSNSRSQEIGNITSGYNTADGRIAATDADRAARVLVLGQQASQAYSTAQQASTMANQANSTAVSASQIGNQANQTATAADAQARNVWSTANLANTYANNSASLASTANANANTANANAGQAYNNANVANGTAQNANGSAQYANYVANVAANNAQQAINYASSAYNSANYAYSLGSSANGSANWAYNTAMSANDSANWAYNTGAQAASLAQAAYYRPAVVVYSAPQTQWDCSQMYGTACP